MATYKLIASSTVGSGGASSITFSSIPQTYTDLVVKTSLRCTRTFYGDLLIQFNSSSTGYTYKRVYGITNNGTATSNSDGWTIIDSNGNTANTFASNDFYIPNYTSSNNKSWSVDNVAEDNTNDAYPTLACGVWANSAAITSINLYVGTGFNFTQYSTAYLYGISNA